MSYSMAHYRPFFVWKTYAKFHSLEACMCTNRGVKRLTVGLPTVCGVWEIGQSVDKTKQFCVHAYAQQCDTSTRWRVWWFKLSPCDASRWRRTYMSPRMSSMTSHCNTVIIGHSVGLRQYYLHGVFLIYALYQKTVGEMSENMRLFDPVNGGGIVNGHSKFFSFISCTSSNTRSIHQYQAYGL